MDCNIYRTPVQNFWLRGWFKKSFIKHSIRKPKVHLSSTYCYRLIMQCARRNNFQCWSTIYNMASKKLHFEWWKNWNIASTSYWIHQSIKWSRYVYVHTSIHFWFKTERRILKLLWMKMNTTWNIITFCFSIGISSFSLSTLSKNQFHQQIYNKLKEKSREITLDVNVTSHPLSVRMWFW